MRRLWLFMLLAPLALTLGVGPVPATQDFAGQIQFKVVPPAKKAGNLYYVAISEPDRWDFIPKWFDKTVRDQCTPVFNEVHGKVFCARECTRKNLFDGLDWMIENAKADDLVILFVECHGVCVGGRDGESIFGVRDGKIRPRQIKEKMAQLPCQAIFMTDACQSGNWPKEVPPDDVMPPNLTALCCCLSTQNSVIEFPISLFEALYGKADFNKDGYVDLDEVIKYVGYRMREVQGGKLNPVFHKAKSLTSPLRLSKVNPNLITVVHKKEVFAALVDNQDGDNYEVKVIGFDKPGNAGLGGGLIPNKYTRSSIILPSDGIALMVRKTGGWFPAYLVSKDGDNYKVRYVGSNSGEDTVAAEDVRHLFALNPSEEIPPGLFNRRN